MSLSSRARRAPLTLTAAVALTAEDSPTGAPLPVVGNQISGTTTIWRVEAPGA